MEDVSQRTESSSTFANPDGTWSVESFTGPIRAEVREGVWRDLDETLMRSGDVVRPQVPASPLTLPDGAQARAGVSPLATLKGEDSEGRTVSLGLDWPGSLPSPVLDGADRDVCGCWYGTIESGAADVVVEALLGGFSHSVVLHERPVTAVTYRFPIRLSDGLSLQVADTGVLHVVDGVGETVFYAPRPRMWDARVDEVSGDPVRVVPLDAAVEAGEGGPVLVLVTDSAFLADPATVYPVTVDPSWTGVISSDTWVQYNDYLESQNSSAELKAGMYNGSEKARSF